MFTHDINVKEYKLYHIKKSLKIGTYLKLFFNRKNLSYEVYY